MATAFAYRSNERTLSDSDSDDSDKECLNWKRATKNEEVLEQIPIAPLPDEPPPTLSSNVSSLKRKRNTIWCEVLEDQLMSETLNHCGIKNKPKDYGCRGEESYDYTLGKKRFDHTSDEESHTDSRSRSSSSRRSRSCHKRFKSDKFVEIDAAGAQAAKKIVRVLAEEKVYLIYRVVKHLGVEKAMKILKMTEEIEDNGGIMIKNQQRRRTPGGVYLHLLRSDKSISKEILDKIFDGELNSYEKKRKFDELRKRKRKNRRKRKANGKNSMECDEPSSPENTINEKNSVEQQMEAEIENDINECPIPEENGKTSDLEEGEVE